MFTAALFVVTKKSRISPDVLPQMKDQTNRFIRPRDFYSAVERKELVVQEMGRKDLQNILLSEQKKSNPKSLHAMWLHLNMLKWHNFGTGWQGSEFRDQGLGEGAVSIKGWTWNTPVVLRMFIGCLGCGSGCRHLHRWFNCTELTYTKMRVRKIGTSE